MKEIISKLRTVSTKMGNVLEYHQALGLVPLHELDQKCLALKKQQSLEQVKVRRIPKLVTKYIIATLHFHFTIDVLHYILEADATAARVHLLVQYWTTSAKLSP